MCFLAKGLLSDGWKRTAKMYLSRDKYIFASLLAAAAVAKGFLVSR